MTPKQKFTEFCKEQGITAVYRRDVAAGCHQLTAHRKGVAGSSVLLWRDSCAPDWKGCLLMARVAPALQRRARR